MKQRQNGDRLESFNYSISLSLLFLYLCGAVQFRQLTSHITCICCSKRWEGKACHCNVVRPHEDYCHQLYCRKPAEQMWRNKRGQTPFRMESTRCDNLIPGIVAACRCGVEPGKLVYSSTSGHVPTCVYTSHSLNESFVPESQRK